LIYLVSTQIIEETYVTNTIDVKELFSFSLAIVTSKETQKTMKLL